MIKKATCPNCGAEGTVGRYCEFCGTKIPAPIVKQASNSKQGNLLIVEDRLTTENLIAGLPNALANQEDVSTDVFDDIEVKMSQNTSYRCTHIMELFKLLGHA